MSVHSCLKAAFLCIFLAGCSTNPVPTVALTFDVYATTYSTAFPIMRERGLVGTFFVDPDYLDRIGLVEELKPMVTTTAQLKEMHQAGWSIQVHTGQNMISFLRTEGPDITRKKLAGMKSLMAEKGFEVISVAAGGRTWNNDLRGMVDGMYSHVRANDNFSKWQSYPVTDPLWVKDGGTTSLSYEDTPERLSAQLDSLIQSGGLWIVVAHKVGEPGLSSISKKTFSEFCDRLAAEVKAGRIRVVTFEKALSPGL